MDKNSLIRTVILAIALVNQLLTAAGKSPLPVDDATIENLISTTFTTVVAIWTWWKNNYISNKGKAQKEALKEKNLL